MALLEVHRYFRTLCGKLIKTEQGADKGLLGSSVKFLYSLDLQIKIMESRTDGEQVVIVQFRLTFFTAFGPEEAVDKRALLLFFFF